MAVQSMLAPSHGASTDACKHSSSEEVAHTMSLFAFPTIESSLVVLVASPIVFRPLLFMAVAARTGSLAGMVCMPAFILPQRDTKR